MTILFLDQFHDLGGAQLNLLDLVPELRRRSWRGHVALPGQGPLNRRLADLGTPVHSLPVSRYSLGRKNPIDALRFVRDLPELARTIRGLVEKTEAALLYVNGPRLMPAVAWAGLKLPVVFHINNRVGAGSGAPLVRWAVNRTGATVIASSRFVAQDYPGATVVYSGVPGPTRVPGRRDRDSLGLRIGMFGRIGPQKRQWEFVLAAAQLAPQWPEASFVLCGDAVFGDREARAYKDHVLAIAPPSLHYLGWRDDVYEVLEYLDLVVMPSAGEGGVPRVVLEAFSAGVPVLARASGAVTEVIEEGHNGFLLHEGSAEEISTRVRELAKRPDLLDHVVTVARRQWADRFRASRFQHEMGSVLESRCASAIEAGSRG